MVELYSVNSVSEIIEHTNTHGSKLPTLQLKFSNCESNKYYIRILAIPKKVVFILFFSCFRLNAVICIPQHKILMLINVESQEVHTHVYAV